MIPASPVTGDQCRLCSSSVNLLDIFILPNIREKIRDLLHIFVCADDFLPKMVCIVCFGQLDKFDRFVRASQDTQEKLLKFTRGTVVTETAPNNEINPIAYNQEVVPVLVKESHSDIYKEELSSDERVNDMVPLVELSDDSCDMECDSDSDVEFVDIQPFPMPIVDPAQSSLLFSADEDSSMETKPEFKPELLNNRLVCHRNLQVGSSFFVYYQTLLINLMDKAPLTPLNEYKPELKHIGKRGSSISANQGQDKGCQIEIVVRARHQSWRPRKHSRWSAGQKFQMHQHFFHHYQNFDVPNEQEIVDFLAKINDDSFYGKTYKQVKTYFANRRGRNSYLSKKG